VPASCRRAHRVSPQQRKCEWSVAFLRQLVLRQLVLPPTLCRGGRADGAQEAVNQPEAHPGAVDAGTEASGFEVHSSGREQGP
jgi:hypothetical protein